MQWRDPSTVGCGVDARSVVYQANPLGGGVDERTGARLGRSLKAARVDLAECGQKGRRGCASGRG